MLETTVKNNQPRRDAIQADLDRYLDDGKLIEVLTTEPTDRAPKYHGYFNPYSQGE